MGASYADIFARADPKYDKEAKKFDEAYYILEGIQIDMKQDACEEDQFDNAADTGRASGMLKAALILLQRVRQPVSQSILEKLKEESNETK